MLVECVRSIWICDQFNWSDLEETNSKYVAQYRMLFINRIRVLLQMTETPIKGPLIEPTSMLYQFRWRSRASFHPGRHLNLWRLYGVNYRPGPMDGSISASGIVTRDRVLTFHLWPMILLIGIILISCWRIIFLKRRLRLRKELGLCLKCGYNLTGNVSGVCPECGERI